MTRTTNPNLAAILPDLNEGWSWSVEFGGVSEIKLHDPNGKIHAREIEYLTDTGLYSEWVATPPERITDSVIRDNAVDLLKKVSKELETDRQRFQRIQELNARFVDEAEDD